MKVEKDPICRENPNILVKDCQEDWNDRYYWCMEIGGIRMFL